RTPVISSYNTVSFSLHPGGEKSNLPYHEGVVHSGYFLKINGVVALAPVHFMEISITDWIRGLCGCQDKEL
ncbi:MAG: hypothetical protein AAFV33_22110, partial [Chloroflexota bacterium]